MGEDSRSAGPITYDIAGLLRCLAQHLRAKIFLRILELHLLGDRDSVVADDRYTPFLLNEDGFGLRTERDAHGIGELGRAAQHLLTRAGAKENLFRGHRFDPSASERNALPEHLDCMR